MKRKPKPWRFTAALLAALTIVPAIPGQGGVSAEPKKNNPDSPWQLVWNDEFDDGVIDPAKWTFDIGNGAGGWGNNELEYYTSRPENVTEKDGKLVITARKEDYEGFHYTSAKIKSSGLFSKAYGKFEIRAKAPAGKGYWPAIWMMPEDSIYGTWAASGEIDIMEGWGSKPGVVAGTLHYGQQWPNNTYTGKSYTLPNNSTIEDFHTYALEWEPGEIRWYVDGQLYQTQNDWYSKSLYQPANNAYPAPFDQPFYMIMNLAIGGNFDGNPDAGTVFPKTMEIDYVRVYELAGRPYREPVPPVMPKEPLPPNARMPLPDGNYVYNGQFNQDDPDVPNLDNVPNTDYWRLWTGEGGTGSVSLDTIFGSNYAKISIQSGGSQPYSVQLLNDVSIAKGHFYKLSFDAKSSEDRQMGVRVTGGESRGYAAYSPSSTINLTPELRHYELAFQMKQDTDIAARTEFNAGLSTKTVWIGNVRLEEIDGIPVDYDAPKTPLDGDGNHVYNGTFDQGDPHRMTFWHVDASEEAIVTPRVDPKERKLIVDIKRPGKAGQGYVEVAQKGIQLIQNMDYQLTFEASANNPRDIAIEWISKDGKTSYAKQTVSLNKHPANYTVSFHMAAARDNESQLVFHLDDRPGQVKLDNVKLIRTSVYYEPDVVFYPLLNGTFENGLSPWLTAVDSGGAITGTADNGQAKLTVTNQGANPWSTMFIQNGLKLFKGVTYEIDFDARASVARKIEVDLENAAYFRFFDQVVDVSPESKHYHFEFTMPNNENVSLKYFFGLIQGTTAVGANHDVWLDNVDLKVKNAPVKRSPQLMQDITQNRVGNPIDVTFSDDPQWRANVTAVKVNGAALGTGQYSFSAGTLQLAASNFPAADMYTITVEADGYAFTSVTQTILAAGGNLIRNGDFTNDTNNWGKYIADGSDAALSADAGRLKVAFANYDGWFPWSTQVYQDQLPLEAGKTYTLRFDASATAVKDIIVSIEKATDFNIKYLDAQNLSLTPDMTSYTFEFTPVSSESNAKLIFQLGSNNANGPHFNGQAVYFDNISLTEK
ncbi:glycosyl hydrolase family protein [Cohnella pontilimi]|uniref:Glycosyl hydrolase family protein n=1 Tax=Cohnella pontilimi TaxID=2564100 RepID=A0A4U0F9N1_9BACL|nr:carbohydrate binding domain-containing protein [Cohnella pontilimi]TJY41407.1 glycosyl hydrolase family protein [Cohnella pontilimi]